MKINKICLPGILLISVVQPVHASEESELDQAIRQLNAAEQALARAKQQAKTDIKHRFYFDYQQAQTDIDKIRRGINRYVNSERAQPRDMKQLKALSGDYERHRGSK